MTRQFSFSLRIKFHMLQYIDRNVMIEKRNVEGLVRSGPFYCVTKLKMLFH